MKPLNPSERANLQAALNLATAIREVEEEGRYTLFEIFKSRGGSEQVVTGGFKASLSGFAAVSNQSNRQAINNLLFQIKNKAAAAGLSVERFAP